MPSGVPYGRLIHAVKADLSQTYPRGAKRNIASLLGYRVVLSSPRILRIIGGLLKAYKQSGLQAMMRKFSLLKVVSPTLDNMERSLPPLSKTFFKERGTLLARTGQTTMQSHLTCRLRDDFDARGGFKSNRGGFAD